ncbi:MAG: sugar O-acetyltransferase [Clostridia bacterium]|nr:sugar O-acetyltransferase [Clostridia bacterium]
MTEQEKIDRGVLFFPGDPELVAVKRRTHMLNQEFNLLTEAQAEEREAVIRKIVGEVGENTYFQGPIRFHYGVHTHIGHHCFFNFNITIQDDAKVVIGNHCDFGPNVTIVTPCHPLLPDERRGIETPDGRSLRLCWAEPVTIGDNVWVGANAVILPGVSIGDNCVIGAGTVVTKSIPANSVAVGNPARVIKTLSEADSLKHHPEILQDNKIL